jgi:hypothetical protein
MSEDRRAVVIASQDSTAATMREAVSFSLSSFGAAARDEARYTAEDRAFFAAEQEKLSAYLPRLVAAMQAVVDHDLGPALDCRLRLAAGEADLTEAIRFANAETKLALRGKSGLRSRHVFGKDVSALVFAAQTKRPALVLAAAGRMEMLPPFPRRAALKDDLIARATRQQALLTEREAMRLARGGLIAAVGELIVEGGRLLRRAKLGLESRFLNDRERVASLFLDVSPPKRRRPDPRVALILGVLAARKIAVDEGQRAAIAAGDDAALARWLTRSVAVSAAGELFGEASAVAA